MKYSNTLKSTLQILSITGTVIVLASCAATQTAIEHRHLESNTKLSQTIFLDPVPSSQKTIYVAVKNTSGEAMDIGTPLKHALVEKGFHIMTNPNNAHYLLQANVLQIAKMSTAASQTALGGGFGSTLAGVGTGAAIGAFSGNTNATLAGGLAGGLISFAADSMVKAVNYTMITDVQISERAGTGVKVSEQFNADLSQGSASTTHQVSHHHSQFQRYRTRIVSNADKVNLTYVNARSILEQGIVKTLAGIF